MANIQRIRDAVASPAAGTWEEEDWDSLIAGELDRQAANTGAEKAELAWLLANALAAHRQVLQRAEAALTRWRTADVEANGPVRFGDTYIRTAPKTTRKIIDQAGLLGWIDHTASRLDAHEDAADLIAAVWRLDAGNLRISTLRTLAERAYRQEHPDAGDEDAAKYARAITDTFIEEKREGAGKLEELPMHKAPKYTQTLGHGHRVGSYRNKEEETDADGDT
jgi:hypothetical protein